MYINKNQNITYSLLSKKSLYKSRIQCDHLRDFSLFYSYYIKKLKLQSLIFSFTNLRHCGKLF